MTQHTCGARSSAGSEICGQPAESKSVASANGAWYCAEHLRLEAEILMRLDELAPGMAETFGIPRQLFQLSLPLRDMIFVGNAISLAIAALAGSTSTELQIRGVLSIQARSLGPDRINSIVDQIHAIIASDKLPTHVHELGEMEFRG